MRGKREHEKFKRGEPLTHKQAILAQCFICNGAEEGGEDCKGESCPLYQHMPYRTGRIKRQISEAQRLKGAEALRRYRESRQRA